MYSPTSTWSRKELSLLVDNSRSRQCGMKNPRPGISRHVYVCNEEVIDYSKRLGSNSGPVHDGQGVLLSKHRSPTLLQHHGTDLASWLSSKNFMIGLINADTVLYGSHPRSL